MADLTKIKFPLDALVGESTLVLLEMTEIYEYDEKKQKTDKLLGYKTLVGNTDTFERYSVKVLNLSPSLSLQDFQNAAERLSVKFDSAEVGFYRLPGGEWELYVRATDIRIADPKASNGAAKSMGDFLDSATK